MSVKIRKVISFTMLIIFFAVSTALLGNNVAKAESVNVTLYALPENPKTGDAVSVVISVSGVNNSEYTITVTYDAKILQFDSCRNGNASRDGNIVTISGKTGTQPTLDFTAIGEGESQILVTGKSAVSADGETLTIGSSGMKLKVSEGDGSTEKKTEEDSTEEDTDTTEELAGDDGIFANVSVEIDGKKYSVVNDDSYTNLPEGFEAVPSDYDGDLIRAFAHGDDVTILCLRSSDNAMSYFVYDSVDKSFAPYHEFEAGKNKVIITPMPSDIELPQGFTESEYKVDEGKLPVFTDGNDDVYLTHAAVLGQGSGLYYFDPELESFTKFYNPQNEKDVSTPQEPETTSPEPVTDLLPDDGPVGEEDIVSYDTLKGLLILVIVLFVIAAITVVILIIKLARRGDDYGEYYDEDEYYDEADSELSEEEREDADAALGQQDEASAGVNDSEENGDSVKDSDEPKPKVLFSDLNTETGGIIVEEALLDNKNVEVLPKTYEERQDKVKKAMEERPYGIDSAFDVVPGDELPPESLDVVYADSPANGKQDGANADNPANGKQDGANTDGTVSGKLDGAADSQSKTASDSGDAVSGGSKVVSGSGEAVSGGSEEVSGSNETVSGSNEADGDKVVKNDKASLSDLDKEKTVEKKQKKEEIIHTTSKGTRLELPSLDEDDE